jgi:hypothetical protein
VDLGDAVIRKPLTARPEQMMQFSLAQPFAAIDRGSGGEASAPDVVVVGRQRGEISICWRRVNSSR